MGPALVSYSRRCAPVFSTFTERFLELCLYRCSSVCEHVLYTLCYMHDKCGIEVHKGTTLLPNKVLFSQQSPQILKAITYS